MWRIKTTQIVHSYLHLFLHFQWSIFNIAIYGIMNHIVYRDIITSWSMYDDMYLIVKFLSIPSPSAQYNSKQFCSLTCTTFIWCKGKRRDLRLFYTRKTSVCWQCLQTEMMSKRHENVWFDSVLHLSKVVRLQTSFWFVLHFD